jgi:hypothetical protein
MEKKYPPPLRDEGEYKLMSFGPKYREKRKKEKVKRKGIHTEVENVKYIIKGKKGTKEVQNQYIAPGEPIISGAGGIWFPTHM